MTANGEQRYIARLPTKKILLTAQAPGQSSKTEKVRVERRQQSRTAGSHCAPWVSKSRQATRGEARQPRDEGDLSFAKDIWAEDCSLLKMLKMFKATGCPSCSPQAPHMCGQEGVRRSLACLESPPQAGLTPLVLSGANRQKGHAGHKGKGDCHWCQWTREHHVTQDGLNNQVHSLPAMHPLPQRSSAGPHHEALPLPRFSFSGLVPDFSSNRWQSSYHRCFQSEHSLPRPIATTRSLFWSQHAINTGGRISGYFSPLTWSLPSLRSVFWACEWMWHELWQRAKQRPMARLPSSPMQTRLSIVPWSHGIGQQTHTFIWGPPNFPEPHPRRSPAF